jgi:hypothetical protein
MRTALALAALAFVLAACGKPAEQAPMAASTNPSWLEKNSVVTGWVTVAQGADGTIVSYDPKSITRDPGAGTADVWVQLQHKAPMVYQSETETTKRELTYTLERVQFRFRCGANQVANIERRLMKDPATVAETIATPPKSDADWRLVAPTGMAAIVEGPACRST